MDHCHPFFSVESDCNEDSRHLFVMGSIQPEQCDHVWELVQGTDHRVNVQDSPDLFCGHCYRPCHGCNHKVGAGWRVHAPRLVPSTARYNMSEAQSPWQAFC